MRALHSSHRCSSQKSGSLHRGQSIASPPDGASSFWTGITKDHTSEQGWTGEEGKKKVLIMDWNLVEQFARRGKAGEKKFLKKKRKLKIVTGTQRKEIYVQKQNDSLENGKSFNRRFCNVRGCYVWKQFFWTDQNSLNLQSCHLQKSSIHCN